MSYDEGKLSKLLSRTQNGDKKAYKEFLMVIIPRLQSRVNEKVFSKNDTHDVVQEILLSIHKALATYDSKRPVWPWVFAICDRRIVDYIRQHTRLKSKETLFEEADVTYLELQTKSNSKEAELAIDDQLEEKLKELPELTRKAIVLTKIDGYSTKEAAQMLGIKENALRTRISRAISSLQAGTKK